MWYEYYQKHNELQDETDNDSGEERKMCVQTAEPPKDVQIVREMSKIKNVKATIHDQIPTELVKEGGKEFTKVIYELIREKFGRKISYHMSGNMAYVQFLRTGT
jgi:hypothetical protein